MLSLIAKKIGMSHLYKENGAAVPFTLVQLHDNCIIDLVVNEEKDFVAGFIADSDRAFFGCVRDPADSYSSLGVRFASPIGRAGAQSLGGVK